MYLFLLLILFNNNDYGIFKITQRNLSKINRNNLLSSSIVIKPKRNEITKTQIEQLLIPN